MPSPKKDPQSDAAKPRAVRRAKDAPIADTARPAKSGNDGAKATSPRTPPPNARVVQPSYKTGTVTRAAARAAVKRLVSNNPPKDASELNVVRSTEDAPVADAAKAAKSTGGAGARNQHTLPPNARVIQDSYKTGTVTRAAARAAAERASGMV